MVIARVMTLRPFQCIGEPELCTGRSVSVYLYLQTQHTPKPRAQEPRARPPFPAHSLGRKQVPEAVKPSCWSLEHGSFGNRIIVKRGKTGGNGQGGVG